MQNIAHQVTMNNLLMIFGADGEEYYLSYDEYVYYSLLGEFLCQDF